MPQLAKSLTGMLVLHPAGYNGAPTREHRPLCDVISKPSRSTYWLPLRYITAPTLKPPNSCVRFARLVVLPELQVPVESTGPKNLGVVRCSSTRRRRHGASPERIDALAYPAAVCGVPPNAAVRRIRVRLSSTSRATFDHGRIPARNHPGRVPVRTVHPQIAHIVEGAVLVGTCSGISHIRLTIALSAMCLYRIACAPIRSDVPGFRRKRQTNHEEQEQPNGTADRRRQ